MPSLYAPLRQHSTLDAERELDAAFESDADDDDDAAHESTPLQPHAHSGPALALDTEPTSSLPGAYDFERPYDHPPPGSPPRPSAFALPNDIGNSNGTMPGAPARAPVLRPSFFRRAVGAVLPTHYARVPTEARPTGYTGGGGENDGVFANVTAKPSRARTVVAPDGNIHLVPEDNQKEAPPSYADAQADSVPPYWETTVHAPADGILGTDMIIDDLPTGSVWLFVLNLFVSFFFQFVGFVLTYLLHTSHAAKYGSRAGLGLTLIQYGFYTRERSDGADDDPDALAQKAALPGLRAADRVDLPPAAPTDPAMVALTSRDWISFLLMTVGWFLLLSSLIGFWRVKRWETSIRSSAAPGPVTPEEIERDIAVRRNIGNAFGLYEGEDEDAALPVRRDAAGNIIPVTQEQLEEARLARDLRAAGLL